MINTIKNLGVGLGYRHEISADIEQNADLIDFVEVISEKYMTSQQGWYLLNQLREKFVIIPHGVSLSIGSPQLDMDHLKNIKAVCDITQCPYYSEHLCITRSPGIDIGHLSPMEYTQESLAIVIKNVNVVQDVIERPLILENITYKFAWPGNELSEEEFFTRLCDETGCGLLVDVTNIHTNSFNHQWDAVEYINNLPIKNTVQAHVAGGFYDMHGELIDSHDHAIEEKSFELLEILSSVAPIKGVVLEHDDNFPSDFHHIIAELNIIKKIISGASWRESYQHIMEAV